MFSVYTHTYLYTYKFQVLVSQRHLFYAVGCPKNQEGRSAVPMDVTLGNEYDLLSDVGFSNALYQVANLVPGSGHTTAPVCSTFVWMPPSCNTRLTFSF